MRSLNQLAAITLALTLAAPAAEALPVRGTFSGVIASETNADFTARYSAGDSWSLAFQFRDEAAPAFVGADFADYSLSSFNFVSLRLNNFSTRPINNGFAMRVQNDSFFLFGPLNTNTFPSPFDRTGFYNFFVGVEGPGIATDFTDLSTVDPTAIENATALASINVRGESNRTFGGSTRAFLTLNSTSVERILPPPPPPPPMTAVPVPAAGVLFASLWGLLAVWSVRRRRKLA